MPLVLRPIMEINKRSWALRNFAGMEIRQSRWHPRQRRASHLEVLGLLELLDIQRLASQVNVVLNHI